MATGRTWLWRTAAAVCALAAIGLVVLMLLDPDGADRTASVVGTTVLLIGTAFSLWRAAATPATSAPEPGRSVRADGAGSTAVGGDMTGNAVGDRSTVGGSPSSAPAPGATTVGGSLTVRAENGGIAVGGDMTGNALGAGSRVASGPLPAPGPAPVSIGGDLDVRAENGGTAVGGTMSGNALGEDSGTG
ncbi:hypothetical protein ACIQBJ_07330 [Kitasatospora sp. NPDC088391]|uniref:hypothetical protein n=1 Tax=Kitasatospora sp. NPDC088391 TaxID=3364074 RepID=UPI00380FF7BF